MSKDPVSKDPSVEGPSVEGPSAEGPSVEGPSVEGLTGWALPDEDTVDLQLALYASMDRS